MKEIKKLSLEEIELLEEEAGEPNGALCQGYRFWCLTPWSSAPCNADLERYYCGNVIVATPRPPQPTPCSSTWCR